MQNKKENATKSNKKMHSKASVKMNKTEKLIALGLIIFILVFGTITFKKTYFNEVYYKVPDLIGLDYQETEDELGSSKIRLRNMGEVFSPLPYGTIVLQEPAPGSTVKRHRNVKVWVSKAPEAVFVPNLVNMNYLDAKSLAEQQGLIVSKITKIRSSEIGINRVVATSLKTDAPLNKGEEIAFLVSLGY